MRVPMFRTLLPAFMTVAALAVGCDRGDQPGQTTAGTPKPQVAEQPKPATKPIIPVAQMADWCPEHAMPESICVQCNASLAAGFKAKGDWCEEHGVPKSQDFAHNPGLKQKFAAAYKEKYGKEPPAGGDHDHDHEKK